MLDKCFVLQTFRVRVTIGVRIRIRIAVLETALTIAVFDRLRKRNFRRRRLDTLWTTAAMFSSICLLQLQCCNVCLEVAMFVRTFPSNLLLWLLSQSKQRWHWIPQFHWIITTSARLDFTKEKIIFSRNHVQ